MGHAFDCDLYWIPDDFIQYDNYRINLTVISELKRLNIQIRQLIAGQYPARQYTEALYELTLSLSLFVQKNYVDIQSAFMLQLQLLMTLRKIKKHQSTVCSSTHKLLQGVGKYFLTHLPKQLTPIQLHQLLVYETYDFLGLTGQLSVQDKLSLNKVRNLDLYSQLLSLYCKPKIEAQYLEQYFSTHRQVLLEDLVNTKKKILHIHYDEEFLTQYVLQYMALELSGQETNTFINRQVQHEFNSAI